MKNKKIVVVFIILIIGIFLGLHISKANKVYSNKANIVVVENIPGKSKAYFNLLDDDLNVKERIKIKHSRIGTNTKSLEINGDKIYITQQVEKSLLGNKSSEKLLVYNLNDLKESTVELPSSKPDSILVDKDNIYTSYNWSEGVFMYKQDKDGKNPKKRVLDTKNHGRIEYLIDMGDKIALVDINMDEPRGYINIISKDSMKTLKVIPLEKGLFPFYSDILQKDGILYMVGSTEEEHYRSLLTIVNIKSGKVENYKYNSDEFISVFDNKDKLVIFACDNKKDSNSKSTVYELNKNNKELNKKGRFDFPIKKVMKKGDNYITIAFDNICKISKDYKFLKKIKVEGYNSQIFER